VSRNDNRRGHLRFWAIFLVAAAACAGTVWLISEAVGGFSFGQEGPRLVYLIMLAALIGSALLLGRRIGLSDAIKSIGIWILIGLLLVAGYAYRTEITQVWHRVTGALDPGVTVREDQQRLVIAVSADGHFHADVKLNGTPVRMLVDTGATTTAIPPAVARRAGLDLGSLRYTITVNTANGQTRAASARLKTLSIGPVTLKDVRVLVGSRQGGPSVLGMSTLRRFRRVTIDGDRMLIDW